MATAKRSKQHAAKRHAKKPTRKPRATPAQTTAEQKAPKEVVAADGEKTKPAVPLHSRLPSAWTIGRKAVSTLRQHWLLFGGILVLYILLSVILVRGFGSGINLSSLKNTLSGNFSGSFSGVWTGLTVFTVLLTASSNYSSDAAGVYQAILTIIVSLATVWALRQVAANTANTANGTAQVRIRDAFYKGMYPLIPVLLVLLVIFLQLLPFIMAGFIYGLVTSNGIAVNILERVLWLIVFAAGIAISGYFLTSSLLAIYICALPDMTPLKALRSARKLVRGRRWSVIRKLLALPLALFIAEAVIMVPIIMIAPPLVIPVLYVLTLVMLLFIHAYMYTLYRELLA